MALIGRAQVVMPYYTNLPEDVITNTWHFEDLTTNESIEVLADLVQPSLSAFYGTFYTNLPLHMAPLAAHHVNWYDITLPPPRPPYTLPLWDVAPTSQGTEIPLEAALVVSFQGVPVAGVPQARRRGRVYLGALVDGDVLTDTATTFPMINPASVARAHNAAEALLAANSVDAHRWVIWSPTTSTAVNVANGWVDNEIDTQRRRGAVATQRSIWPD